MTDRKLAEAHVKWEIDLLRSHWEAWITLTEQLMLENFVHGIKHGRELEKEAKLSSLNQFG